MVWWYHTVTQTVCVSTPLSLGLHSSLESFGHGAWRQAKLTSAAASGLRGYAARSTHTYVDAARHCSDLSVVTEISIMSAAKQGGYRGWRQWTKSPARASSSCSCHTHRGQLRNSSSPHFPLCTRALPTRHNLCSASSLPPFRPPAPTHTKYGRCRQRHQCRLAQERGWWGSLHHRARLQARSPPAALWVSATV